jgi:hypothetical protein
MMGMEMGWRRRGRFYSLLVRVREWEEKGVNYVSVV